MSKRLAAKVAVLVALATVPERSVEARPVATSSSCGRCIAGGCPSAFTWDELCHMYCQPTDLGWCSSGDTSGRCGMYFDGYLQCGTGNVS